jgi:hypothetical protein
VAEAGGRPHIISGSIDDRLDRVSKYVMNMRFRVEAIDESMNASDMNK